MQDLHAALASLGYSISQKARVLDYVSAAAADPEASPVGPLTLADELTTRPRAGAGPLRNDHPWLRPWDWGRAFKMHFDFVVHESPLHPTRPTHPLFAVEFDGITTHNTPGVRQRDLSKNRLCAASGLQLLRIDHTFLYRRERLSTIFWLAQLWHAYRTDMPRMLADRDRAINSMSPEEFEAAGEFLFAERPDLDVHFVLGLEHPFPPVQTVAARLANQYGFWWSEVSEATARDAEPRWKVSSYTPATSVQTSGLIERWETTLEIHAPGDETRTLTGRADVRIGYPLSDDPAYSDSWTAIAEGRLPWLPAGPFRAASTYLGKALCTHNALIEIEHYLRKRSR